MKSVRLLVVAFALITFISAQADNKRNAKDNKKVAVEDTISSATFSYAFGVLQSENLDKYVINKMNVDKDYLKYFEKGMKDYLKSKNTKKIVAYAAGLQIAKELKENIIPTASENIIGNKNSDYINTKIISEVIIKALLNKPLEISKDSAEKIIQKQIEIFNMKKKKINEDFMNNISKEEGVKELEGGVYYKIIKKGNGIRPSKTSSVTVNYEGRLTDGTIFDSSYKRNKPITLKADQVIKGWNIALTHMPIGSIWEVYIPYDKAYGERGTKGIPGYSPLIFKIEILDVK